MIRAGCCAAGDAGRGPPPNPDHGYGRNDVVRRRHLQHRGWRIQAVCLRSDAGNRIEAARAQALFGADLP